MTARKMRLFQINITITIKEKYYDNLGQNVPYTMWYNVPLKLF